MSAWWLLLIPLVVALIYLEGRRQARKLGKTQGRRGSTGADLLGVGMLEFQQLLQPDRDVETTFHVACEPADSPLELWDRLATKLVLNLMSTATMARLGRVEGNYMSRVETTRVSDSGSS